MLIVQGPSVTNSYFVFFNDQSVAAAAAQCSLFPENSTDAFRVMAAPGPEEVRLPSPCHILLFLNAVRLVAQWY